MPARLGQQERVLLSVKGFVEGTQLIVGFGLPIQRPGWMGKAIGVLKCEFQKRVKAMGICQRASGSVDKIWRRIPGAKSKQSVRCLIKRSHALVLVGRDIGNRGRRCPSVGIRFAG